jgi:hypothetical protein
MISYSQKKEIFSAKEVKLFEMATRLVDNLEDIPGLRCHELARAVGQVLHLDSQDGWFGDVAHSWLWTSKPQSNFFVPNILDVYSVGCLPMVRLIDMKHILPYNLAYKWGSYGMHRTDIKERLVSKIAKSLLQPDIGAWIDQGT